MTEKKSIVREAQRDAALRISQSVAVVRQMPMVLFGNGLGCLIGSLAMQETYSLAQRLPLVLGMWILLLPVAHNWWRLRRRPVPATVSRQRIVKLTVYSGVLGCAWAASMLWYLPNASFEVTAFLIMGCAFLAAGSAAVLYVVPAACVAYTAPILGAALFLTATSGSHSASSLTLLVALMSGGIGWMLYANWKNFHMLFAVSIEKTLLLEAAAKAAVAKSEFLENISHEIRNPLTSVIGYANLLRAAEGLPAELREYARNVTNGGAALQVLLNDLLDMAKLDAGRIELTPVPFQLRELLNDAAALVSISATAKGLTLNVEVDPGVPDWLICDPFRLRQVMLNLLSNAIKFTDRGYIGVNANWAPIGDDDGQLIIRVSDTGPGIPEATRDLLFKRFSQLCDTTAKRHTGAGLGLAISQRLVELMGGHIGVTSKLEAGTCFHVQLPVRTARSPILQKDGFMPIEAVVNKRVLVVDDIAINRQLVVTMLKPFGHSIVEANGGTQAITLCTSQQFDVILMDIDMPCVDGLVATRLIRGQCSLNSMTPIIAVTGHIASSQLVEFKNAGMNDYLAKPLSNEALISVVHRWAVPDPLQT